ncbi:hypothetical protein G6F65_023424 [Rhizopus arrhizus]|nr:hypothetical protein G6F65_023424 [Rhizopus arrhizus]
MWPLGTHVQKGQVDVLGLPGRVLAGGQVGLDPDVGVQFNEAANARREPQRSQRRVGRHVQRVAAPAARGGPSIAAGGVQ